MRLSVTTPCVSDAHAVQALHGWLLRSPDLDADITQTSSVTGHMGALDVIDIVLTHSVAAANLVIAAITAAATMRLDEQRTLER